MKRSVRVTSAFSLVEVTLALGIAAFCLIAVIGTIPIGVQTNRNAKSQTASTNIMSAVISDLRATPVSSSTSLQFAIPIPASTPGPTPITRYFDSQAQCSCDNAGLLRVNPLTRTCTLTWSPALQPRYRLDITWNSAPTGLRYAYLKVWWPAAAASADASGSAEMFAAFDRN
jgi:hypothetical protein